MTSKIPLAIIGAALLIGIGIIFFRAPNPTSRDVAVPNTEIRDGIQYIMINAGGGYSPRVSDAQAGIPTKLIVKTKGTYDCSSSLIIQSLNVQKILPQTGEEEIDIGIPEKGTPLSGTCGMGMYNFTINFE